jgi:hypothetical protein
VPRSRVLGAGVDQVQNKEDLINKVLMLLVPYLQSLADAILVVTSTALSLAHELHRHRRIAPAEGDNVLRQTGRKLCLPCAQACALLR